MGLNVLCRRLKRETNCDSESGATLIEVLVALVVIGALAATFVTGVGITSKASFSTDRLSTARSIAASQVEWVKSDAYIYDVTEYTPAPLPAVKDYINYSVTITATPLHTPDDGIQKIVVVVKYDGQDILRLEDYKVDR